MRNIVKKMRDWETYHKEVPAEEHPWNHDDIDRDIWKALEECRDPIFEIGFGNGYQLQRLLELGRDVYGSEICSEPLQRLVDRMGPAIAHRLFVDDIRKVAIKKTFSTIVDRGVFHVLETEDRPRYVHSISKLLALHGKLIIKGFSAQMPDPGFGPHRISKSDLEASFLPWFTITEFSLCSFELNRHKIQRQAPTGFIATIEWATTRRGL
jgi:Methyltransferase domain